MKFLNDLLTNTENSHYANFKTSMAIRSKVQKYIAELPEDQKEAARNKRDVLYKLGVPWPSIRKAIMEEVQKDGSKDRYNPDSKG